MAEVLAEMPRKRDVDGWYLKFMDGQVWKVVNGVDFNAKTFNAAQNGFRLGFSRHGKRATIRVMSNDPLTLAVQALPKE